GIHARRSYDHAFVPGASFLDGAFPSAPTAPHFFGGTAHDFGGGDVFQRITMSAGGRVVLSLQWDSPFFSVSGGAGTSNDLDVYLLNATRTQVVAGSTRSNVRPGSGDPSELLTFTNTTGVTEEFNIILLRFDGPNPVRLITTP